MSLPDPSFWLNLGNNVGEIRAMLEASVKRQDEHTETLKSHNRRITSLERYRWKIAGATALALFLISAAFKVASVLGR